MKPLTSLYSYRYPAVIVYMLQSCEYRVLPYLKWLWRTRDFSTVRNRGNLKRTKYARLLLYILSAGIIIQIAIGLVLIILGIADHLAGYWAFGIAVIVAYPIVWPHLIVLPLELGRLYIVEPKQEGQVKQSAEIFATHQAVKIAVAGSYGKTTMKEVLRTVLSEGKHVAATEANHNVAIEHAKFAQRLRGDEEVLIIEYGEGAPGDVRKFSEHTHPTHGIITGLAPAHLDSYKTMEAAAADIFSLASYLKSKNVYVNIDSEAAAPHIQESFVKYGEKGAGDWKATDVQVMNDGLSFKLKNGKKIIELKSALLGRHQVGTLSLAVLIGLELGLSEDQVRAGVAKTAPFEHRMQPYHLGGALIIDDTYNGNIDGIRAGTKLLSELSAKRKIYVTPGLVEQGGESETVHTVMGRLIAASQPDIVVLMSNSASEYIQNGLNEGVFKGELIVEENPLNFYHNLEHFVAAGDLVMMQNDWPDNYS